MVQVDGEFYNVEQEGERAPFKAFLDIGLARTTTGAKIFAVMKGVADGGIEVPHRFARNSFFLNFYFYSENRFYGYDSESKEYNAEAHRERIFGKHVADYMNSLKEDDEDSYKRQFSKFISSGVNSSSIEEVGL